MKQTIIKALTTVVAAIISINSATAYDFEVDGLYYNYLSQEDHTVEVSSDGYTYMKTLSGHDLVIPDKVTYDGNIYTVVKIGYSAFYDVGLKSVVIPNTVTEIGERAFLGATLESIEIPNSVTTIGELAFACGRSLKSVEIPASVCDISQRAFSFCRSLTHINVSEDNPKYSVIDNVLYDMEDKTLVRYPAGLKSSSFVIPDFVQSIGACAFDYSSSLTSIEIPNSITSIGDHAFDECTALAFVEIPNSVTRIGEYAFSDCSSLTSVEIPNSVTRIEDSAFADCVSLTSINIPNSVTWIGSSAFGICTSLTSVVIPNTIASIESNTFDRCTSLLSITIPESVERIGMRAFEGSALKAIYCKPIYPPIIVVDPICGNPGEVFGSTIYENAMLYVPYKEAYEKAETWKKFHNIVELHLTADEEVEIGGGLTVEAVDGAIVVGAADATVEVYSLNGRCVYRGEAGRIAGLERGVYIVRSGSDTRKVLL